MRAYNGTVFRLDNHITRLMASTRTLGITINAETVTLAVKETLKANDLVNARVRLTISAGEGSMVPNPDNCQKPTILVVAADYQPFAEEVYEKGYKLITSFIRRNAGSPVPSMKSLNYMECMLARREARADGYDEALLLNEANMLAETTTSNIFMVKQGVILTPGIESGILPGITRYVIMELAARLGIDFMFSEIPREAAFEADELFISNSIMEIMPVSELDNTVIGDRNPCVVTQRLRQAYHDLVEEETAVKR